MEKFLGSGIIEGIGPVYAKKIVKAFGENSIEVISKSSWKLEGIRGIGAQRRKKIVASWKKHSAIADILRFLKEHDISNSDAFRIYQIWKNDSIDKIKENPYRLSTIPRIGFKKADAVASSLGYSGEHPFRIRAGLRYALEDAAGNGNTALKRASLIKLASSKKILDVNPSKVDEVLGVLVENDSVVVLQDGEDELMSLRIYAEAEEDIADRLFAISKAPLPWTCAPLPVPDDFPYSPSQVEAIKAAMTSKILVVTGGPGVGKTTVTKTILNLLDKMKKTSVEMALAAPTGRAAKRMSEATNRGCLTIHRMLGPQGGYDFSYNENNPLECDVIVMDETSMLDTRLTSSTLRAAPDTAVVIFIGDVDQLPSVGAGNVLNDIIKTGVIPVVRLTEVHRQDEHSTIVTNAYDIINGRMPDITNDPDGDFFFIKEERENISQTIADLVSKRLPAKYDCTSDSIQVLSPMNKGVAGNWEINALLQNSLNPSSSDKEEKNVAGTVFRVGDRVMQTKNDYDYDVYNGDMGKITEISSEKGVHVDFEGNDIAFESTDAFYNMMHSFACSVHKSQGSEYEIVIIPVTHAHYALLNRNIMYTAVTRAKRLVVMVGEIDALKTAVSVYKKVNRTTGLQQRILHAFNSH